MDKTFLILSVSGTLIVFGLFLYLIIVYEKKRRNKFLATAIETEGTVQGIRLGFFGTFLTFFLNYSYTDKYGILHQASENIGLFIFGYEKRYKKGNKITIYYDPTNPTNSTIFIKNKGN